MSARQRARLARKTNIEDSDQSSDEENDVIADFTEDNDVEEDDEEKEFTITKSQAFNFGESTSASSSSDEQSEGEDHCEIIIPAKSSQPSKDNSTKQQQNTFDEGKYLDDLIEENKKSFSTLGISVTENALFDEVELLCLTDIDPKALDLDDFIRARFGRLEGEEGNDNNAGGRRVRGLMRINQRPQPKNRAHQTNATSVKKYLFGGIKEDWIKPPSFIGGGIGMKKLIFDVNDDIDDDPNLEEQLSHAQQKKKVKKRSTTSITNKQQQLTSTSRQFFSFEWSKDYLQLHHSYQILKESNDPNYLIMFLVNHPQYIEGFYDLMLLYIDMGQIDKALSLCRRIIYSYESAFVSSFKCGYGHCYLDPSMRENQVFCKTLQKMAQIISIQGYHRLACDLSRILLGLQPVDQAGLQVLLSLDYYCLMAKRYDIILWMTGWIHYWQELSQRQDVTEFQEEMKHYADRMDERSLLGLDHWKYSYVMDIVSLENEEEIRSPAEIEEERERYENNNNEEVSQRSDSAEKKEGKESEESAESTNNDNNEPSFKSNATSPVVTSIELLPNWWFALAFACYLGGEEESRKRQYKKSEEEEETDKNISATKRLSQLFFTVNHAHFFLLQAILTWPQFYLGILQAMKSQLTPLLTRPMIQQIDIITSHTLFQPFLTTYRLAKNSYLQNLLDCYLLRILPFFQSRGEEMIAWFIMGGERLINDYRKPVHHSRIDEYLIQRQEFYQESQFYLSVKEALVSEPSETSQVSLTRARTQSILKQYGQPDIQQFYQEFPMLPNNLELIQESLLSLSIFNGQMKFPELNKMIKLLRQYVRSRRRLRGGEEDEDDHDITEEGETASLWQRFFYGRQQRYTRSNASTAWQWMLDLDLPLIQLFVYSFFPWYRVPQVVPVH